ncbi:MAG TPA: hypothetical protein VF188_00785 [Longimicrobiales bacterium]
MYEPGRHALRRYPDAVRHRLEVARAVAWESFLDTHTRQALEFADLLAGRIPFDEAVLRYLREMDVPQAMALAIQTRVLVALEGAEGKGPLALVSGAEAPQSGTAAAGERRLRPRGIVDRVRERHRRHEATERTVRLAIARAEERTILLHIENAVAIAGLLEPYTSLSRAVEEYIDLLGLSGGRAQAVFQRTMARLADIHLPAPESTPRVPRPVRPLRREPS